jgi:molybdenum cofactor guanylyltransferase
MTLSAVLLAGGESRRMGFDKATAVVAGEPLWQRQLRLLRRFRPHEIFVSARSEPKWCAPGTKLLLDDAPSRGPMTGIAAALGVLTTSHLLVLAVDMPFVMELDLLNLVSSSKHRCGAVPFVHDRVEPLAAIYPWQSATEFATALSSSDTSLQSLVRHLHNLEQVELLQVCGETAEHYRSVNYPDDFVPSSESRSQPRASLSKDRCE